MNLQHLAEEYVLETSKHIFLTGKAGTGKTTFLKKIVATTKRKFVVVAPTAVAAINVGGMTIHSLFQLPMGIFVPIDHYRGFTDVAVNDRRFLLEHMRMNDNKLTLIRELELLIIDEVSMLNADLLDAVDFILKTIRRNRDVAFGGVQVLFIGDLYQLPPVVNEQSANILLSWYRSSYFYHAQVLQDSPPIYIALEKIFRQRDDKFISILNNIRNNSLTNKDMEWLSSRYNPEDPIDWDKNIILTTHNWKADKINISQLEKISGDVMTYHADIEGEIQAKSVSADVQLHLKVGAQVMFVKNDSSGQLRYYNGRLAVVRRLRSDSIIVSFADNNEDFELEQETWENVRYTYNEAEDTVQSNTLGTFAQYPIRLAWAVTIHKSQGLTFEKVVVDAASAFAAGQVYVALSRCTTMEGLRLMTPISMTVINTDRDIVQWTSDQQDTLSQHVQELPMHKWKYLQDRITVLYDWQKLIYATVQFNKVVATKAVRDKDEILAVTEKIIVHQYELQQIADKFLRQINKIFSEGNNEANLELLVERNTKAINYFIQEIKEKYNMPLNYILDKKLEKGNKVVKKALNKLLDIFEYRIRALSTFTILGRKLINSDSDTKVSITPEIEHRKKKAKEDTKLISLQMFREGKSLHQIATIRELAENTIIGHLTHYVALGELEAQQVIPHDRLDAICTALQGMTNMPLSHIKEQCPEYSYGEIKIAITHLELIAKG